MKFIFKISNSKSLHRFGNWSILMSKFFSVCWNDSLTWSGINDRDSDVRRITIEFSTYAAELAEMRLHCKFYGDGDFCILCGNDRESHGI